MNRTTGAVEMLRLRAMLDKAGIEWHDNTDEIMCRTQLYDGEKLPNKILAYAKASGLCGIYVPERTAVRKVRSFGEVGRCNCSACNWCIDPYDLFCRRCGARFTETIYERGSR